MRSAALLLRKDLRLLARTPAVLLILIVFPLLVATLVALALQSDERRPDVAVVNLDTSGRSVAVGDQRLSIDDYIARLSEDVNVRPLDADAAASALDDGRVSAVLTIPPGLHLRPAVRRAPALADARRQPAVAHRGGRDRPQPRVGGLPAEPAARRRLRRSGPPPGGPGGRGRPARLLRPDRRRPRAAQAAGCSSPGCRSGCATTARTRRPTTSTRWSTSSTRPSATSTWPSPRPTPSAPPSCSR